MVPAASFVDDHGTAVTSFPTGYEYATLYVNGMIQLGGTFTVTPSALVISGGAQLDGDDPMVVELVSQA
ncbi:MAG: DUF4183 domain-containing protein [Alicyclobacillus sp.]|nr:DUF4183 domain-containing protein [Alicyclobacillus sp.]